MKRHPGWLAAAMLLFAVIACNAGKNGNNSNSNEKSTSRTSTADVYVDRINMAKDDDGKPGEPTASFAPDERTVHTVIVLNKAKAGTRVKFVWVAVDVEGAKNRELNSVERTTTADDINIHGHLTWSQDWPKGSYRSEVYINGVLDKTINYTVE